MTPALILTRPVGAAQAATGNDGLSEAERAGYAAMYQRAVRPIDAAERSAAKAWRAARATR